MMHVLYSRANDFCMRAHPYIEQQFDEQQQWAV